MKRNKIRFKHISLVLVVACLLLLTAALFAACNKKGTAIAPAPTAYDINIRYDRETAVLDVRQDVLFQAPDGMSEDALVFHIYANAFDEDNDVIDVLSCQIDRQTVDFEIYGGDRTLLKLPCDVKGGRLFNVNISYRIAVPEGGARLGKKRNSDVVNLTCFYPVLARYEGGWREDEFCAVGDPFYSDISDFYVTLTLDNALSVAASGTVEESEPFEKDGKTLKTAEITAENIRDFGMALGLPCKVSTKAETSSGDVEVNYFFSSDQNADETLSVAARALTVFSEAFGDYPYPSFTFAESSLDGAGGMEFGAFAIVSPAARDVYLDAVVHETAHQWWYGAVGNDQLENAWLDEGVSEFCTYYFHYLDGDRARFKGAMRDIAAAYGEFSALKAANLFDGRMERRLDSYMTNGEYVAVVYQKGALLMNTLRELVGDNKFVAAMRQYFESNKFKIATSRSLAAAFKTQGYDVTPILDAWINDKGKL